MKPKIKTRITNLIAKLAGSPDYDPGIQPKEPVEFYLSDAIDGILDGSIGVTPSGVVTATGQMTAVQKKATRENIDAVSTDDLNDYQLKPVVEVITDAVANITPVANKEYKCGVLTSLTISSPPATGSYCIVFTSGATPTAIPVPPAILGLEDFAAEANTMYEINVLDNRAVVGSWAVST